MATLIHSNADRIRSPVAQKIPAGEGVVWDASKLACDEYIKNFCPYVYLGNGVRGLCWFADNDRGWGWNPRTPNLDVLRRDGQVVLRVHLINQPTVIAQPRTICFGLLAAPVKPMLDVPGKTPNDWRYRFLRDNYHLLGTDLNWLALGDCGSVYPAGRDMSLWQASKKATWASSPTRKRPGQSSAGNATTSPTARTPSRDSSVMPSTISQPSRRQDGILLQPRLVPAIRRVRDVQGRMVL